MNHENISIENYINWELFSQTEKYLIEFSTYILDRYGKEYGFSFQSDSEFENLTLGKLKDELLKLGLNFD